MQSDVIVQAEDPNSRDAKELIELLSDTLQSITGDSGKNSFDISDVTVPRSLFVLARNQQGEPIGCGAIRPIDSNIAELKRMYAKSKANGVGSAILSYLEEQSMNFGYSQIWLETRAVNQKAVSFYENKGYSRIDNYGKYINREECICLGKFLS
ncbi:GNAT family N-acetyltransferase [Paenibacillus glycanilyticus]|uniref:N-acetyltransferase n=1 Tax=Paenibacillus glycanilyticus TaxID=126569 RepID=A0ABQ6GDZ8_9BACL|nr:GNAT family N-acetyltransferase [Paenibacillus glycanilyticus]GLX67806.1 N-acetyltransferase [Paenibacillus glycanilyticus]